MKKGDIVTVYEDPLTCTKIEGKAKLVQKTDTPDLEDLEFWIVQFEDTKETVYRKVNKKDEKH